MRATNGHIKYWSRYMALTISLCGITDACYEIVFDSRFDGIYNCTVFQGRSDNSNRPFYLVSMFFLFAITIPSCLGIRFNFSSDT